MDKIEFSVYTREKCKNLHLRINGVYLESKLFEMKEISLNFFQVFVDSSTLPDEELQYHFAEVLDDYQRVIPHTFLASKTNFTVKNFSHFKKGADLNIFLVSANIIELKKERFLNIQFSSKLKNIDQLSINIDGRTETIDFFHETEDSLCSNTLRKVGEDTQDFFLQIRYGEKEYYLNEEGLVTSSPVNINVNHLPVLRSHKAQGLAYLVTKRDFQEIERTLEYLINYHYTEIHLPPFFLSKSNHGYDWIEFGVFDPSYCSKEKYKELIKRAHNSGIKVIQDICITHCHETSEIFRSNSEVRDKFFIKDEQHPGQYKRYIGITDLPVFNLECSEVQTYFIQEIKKMQEELHFDGIRFDSGHTIPESFYNSLLQELGDETIVLYESWSEPKPEFSSKALFFSNYLIRERVLLDFIRTRDSQRFINNFNTYWKVSIAEQIIGYNFISSHDTELVDELDLYKFFLALAFILPGTPLIYHEEVKSHLKDITEHVQYFQQLQQQMCSLSYNKLEFKCIKDLLCLTMPMENKVFHLYFNPSNKTHYIDRLGKELRPNGLVYGRL